MASPTRERVVSNAYSKCVHTLKISEVNVICSIATYYSPGVMSKQKYKVVWLVLSTKTKKKSTEGEPPFVLCINVQCLNFLHTANLLDILIRLILEQVITTPGSHGSIRLD